MTKRESNQLLELVSNLRVKAFLARQWNKENTHRCGHSLDNDSLGDEGWNQLFENEGQARAYEAAADSIEQFVCQKCPQMKETAMRWRKRDER